MYDGIRAPGCSLRKQRDGFAVKVNVRRNSRARDVDVRKQMDLWQKSMYDGIKAPGY